MTNGSRYGAITATTKNVKTIDECKSQCKGRRGCEYWQLWTKNERCDLKVVEATTDDLAGIDSEGIQKEAGLFSGTRHQAYDGDYFPFMAAGNQEYW